MAGSESGPLGGGPGQKARVWVGVWRDFFCNFLGVPAPPLGPVLSWVGGGDPPSHPPGVSKRSLIRTELICSPARKSFLSETAQRAKQFPASKDFPSPLFSSFVWCFSPIARLIPGHRLRYKPVPLSCRMWLPRDCCPPTAPSRGGPPPPPMSTVKPRRTGGGCCNFSFCVHVPLPG